MNLDKEAKKDVKNYTFNDDQFNRKDFAKNIFEHVIIPNDEKNIIIALNGEWGMGKTMLVKMFSNELNNKCFGNSANKKKFLPIYFDSWKNDSWDEPITTLIHSLKEQEKLFDEIDDYVNTYLIHSLKTIGGIGLDVFLNKVGITENHKKRFLDFFKKAKKTKNESDFKLSNEFINYVNSRKQLKEKLENILKKSEYSKAIFFIDELDRCRPTYAIKLLENIKHLFDIPNFIFVLSLDFMQLSESMKVVYGNGMDTQGYLSRFFDYKFNITKPTYNKMFETYLPKLNLHFEDIDVQTIVIEFSRHANILKMGIRDIIIYVNALENLYSFYYDAFHKDSEYVKFIIHSILLMYKYKSNNIYNEMKYAHWRIYPKVNELNITFKDTQSVMYKSEINIKFKGYDKQAFTNQDWKLGWKHILNLDNTLPIDLSQNRINLKGNLSVELQKHKPYILLKQITLFSEEELIHSAENGISIVDAILNSLEMIYVDDLYDYNDTSRDPLKRLY